MLQIPRVLRPMEIDEILHSLPKDLTESYDRLLSRVDESVSQEVTVALEWLSLSKRPLFIEEVLEGIIINPDTSPIYNPDKVLTATDILNCLTGLVTIEPEVPPDEQIQVERHILALAHSSVREYLASPNGHNSTTFRRYHFEERIAHEFIARSCVEYLIHCKLVSWVNNNYPLAKYSDHYWVQHAEHVPGLVPILRRRLSKMWSPILYPKTGATPMLLANGSSEAKGNFVNVTATPNYESLERRVGNFSDNLPDALYSPLETGTEFRLFVLLSSKEWHDPIECRLQVVFLNEVPYFCALSWSWGQISDLGMIIVDGVPTQVPRNLECALRYLRQAQAGYHQVLWVDAICINQQNLMEKSHQVGIMFEIFGIAERVIAWLGAEDESSYLAMRFLSGFQEIPDPPDSVRNRLMSMSTETWNVLQLLFNRTWFSRLWIVREVAVAKEIEIFCGNQSIPWSVLESIERACAVHSSEILEYIFNFRDRDLNIDNPHVQAWR
jgi:Heterokaryon incompatibility protein (HET)